MPYSNTIIKPEAYKAIIFGPEDSVSIRHDAGTVGHPNRLISSEDLRSLLRGGNTRTLKSIDMVLNNSSLYVCGTGSFFGRRYLRIEGTEVSNATSDQIFYIWDSFPQSKSFDIMMRAMDKSFLAKSKAEIRAIISLNYYNGLSYMDYYIGAYDKPSMVLYVPRQAFVETNNLHKDATTLDEFFQ